jgi:hypothetical protein
VLAGALDAGVARGVRVVSIKHDTLILLEVPSPRHPTSVATVAEVVLSEAGLVVGVEGVGTVDELLLRHMHGSGVGLLGQSTFEGRGGGEGPAGTTVALVLDTAHPAIGVVINSGSGMTEMATVGETISVPTVSTISVPTSSIGKRSRLGVGNFGVKTEQLLVLLGLKILGPVASKAESATALAILLLVVVVDCVLVEVEAVLLALEGGEVSHILVKSRGELKELRIVLSLVLACEAHGSS